MTSHNFEYMINIVGDSFLWKNDKNELLELCTNTIVSSNYINKHKQKFLERSQNPEIDNYFISNHFLDHNLMRSNLSIVLVKYILKEYLKQENCVNKDNIAILLNNFDLYNELYCNIKKNKYTSNIVLRNNQRIEDMLTKNEIQEYIKTKDLFDYAYFYINILLFLGTYFISLINNDDYKIIQTNSIKSQEVKDEINEQALSLRFIKTIFCPKQHNICSIDKNERYPFYLCEICRKNYIMDKNWFDDYYLSLVNLFN